MKISKVLAALTLTAFAVACDNDSTPPDPNATLSITIISGNGQPSALIGTTLPNPFVAKVTNANGQPVQGKTVNWTVTGGGTVNPTSSVTDAQGLATTTLTLGSTEGTNTVTASLADRPAATAVFTATARYEEFISTINGAGENPPLTNNATGTATYRLVGPNLMEYTVTATGLTGNGTGTNALTGLHIHGPLLGTGNGGIAVNLCPAALSCTVPTSGANNGVLMSGTTPVVGVAGSFTGANVRADMGATEQARFDSLLVLMRRSDGNAYTNLHTTLNGTGQARGPIVVKPPTSAIRRQD